jgi:hypothetical protein
MNRLIAALAVAVVAVLGVLPVAALAQTEMPLGEHPNGSLGFHTTEAPLGIRWWFPGQKVALDAGIGFGSRPAPSTYPNEKLTNWALDIGVPIVAKSWSKVHLLIRPGVLYTSQQVLASSPPAPFDTNDETSLSVLGELEAEAFLADNFSVSASHGIRYTSFDPAGAGDNVTTFSTIGNNFTNVGFHVYFFGGSR